MRRASGASGGGAGGMNGSARAPRTIVVLHESAGRWRLAVVQGQPVRLLESRGTAPGAVGEVQEVIRRVRAGTLVRIVPGPQTIARCVSIPQAGAGDAAGALALLAEAELPDSVPAHRRAAGVIPDVARAGAQTGLLTGWPVRADQPGRVAPREVPEWWTTEVAALAALRGEGPPAVYADAERGSISLLVSGPARTIARVLVEDNSEPEAWAGSIRRAVSETCRTAGAPGVAPADMADVLTLGESAREGLIGPSAGRSGEPGWLDDFGIALGAAMLALSDEPGLKALAGLAAEAPRERRPAAERVVAWLSIRRNAWIGVGAGLAALLLLPLGVAWARAAVLEAKVAALRAGEGSRRELARSAALYEQLQKSRWPMTKLLADVSGAMPIGVRVESLRLAPDQGLGIEATADSAEALAALQQNLNKTGIFRDVQIARAETGEGGAVSFEVSAAVASPFLGAPPAADFAAQPLAVRLYGEGATNTNWTPEGDKAASSRPARAARPEGGSAAQPGGKGGEEGPTEPSRPSGAGGDEVPAAVTDDQVNAMDRNTAMKAWAARKKALSTHKDLDQASKERLGAEVDKLKARMDATNAK